MQICERPQIEGYHQGRQSSDLYAEYLGATDRHVSLHEDRGGS